MKDPIRTFWLNRTRTPASQNKSARSSKIGAEVGSAATPACLAAVKEESKPIMADSGFGTDDNE